MGLGSIGPLELFIGLIIVLVLFGAKRLPELGASIGKGIRGLKDSLNAPDDAPAPDGRTVDHITRARD